MPDSIGLFITKIRIMIITESQINNGINENKIVRKTV